MMLGAISGLSGPAGITSLCGTGPTILDKPVSRGPRPEGREALAVETIHDPAEFERMREEWNALLKESGSDCFFLTWEWLYTWWKHLAAGRSLFLMAARSGEELSAVAPLSVRRHPLAPFFPFQSLEFLGTGSAGSDYLDLVVRSGREGEALQALAACLPHQSLRLQLVQAKRGSCAAERLARRLSEQGWRVSENETAVCPYIPLRGHTWESYLASLGPRHRYNFRRRLRNLEKSFEVRLEEARSEEERRQALSTLVSLHHRRWCERGGSTAFHTPELVRFHEELSRLALRQGWLRLYLLRLNGKPAAALYGFRYGKVFYFYQSGFDPAYGRHSVGLVMLGLSIKRALEEGAEEYDFLHGDEEYKFLWTRQVRELARLDLYPPNAGGLLYQSSLALVRAARKTARFMLPRVIIDRFAGETRSAPWEVLYAARNH